MSIERKQLINDIRKLAELIKTTATNENNIERANLILNYITRLERYLSNEN